MANHIIQLVLSFSFLIFLGITIYASVKFRRYKKQLINVKDSKNNFKENESFKYLNKKKEDWKKVLISFGVGLLLIILACIIFLSITLK